MKAEKLLTFMYILLRDHLPAGTVESIMVHHVEKQVELGLSPIFSNPFVEAYARELVGRLE
jgi:hypothetical protein